MPSQEAVNSGLVIGYELSGADHDAKIGEIEDAKGHLISAYAYACALYSNELEPGQQMLQKTNETIAKMVLAEHITYDEATIIRERGLEICKIRAGA